MTQDNQEKSKVLFEYTLTQQKLDDYFEYMDEDTPAPTISKDEMDELINDLEDAIHEVVAKFVQDKE